MNKVQIRENFLSKRKNMTTEEINSKSEIINQNIYSILNLYKKLDSVGLFYPFNNEVNILDLCN